MLNKNQNIALETINNLMDKDINDSQYDVLVTLGAELSDAVTAQHGKEANFSCTYEHLKTTTREGYVLSCLGHIAANPSDPERKEILEKTYVYFNNSDDDINYNQYKNVLNYYSSISKLFIDELIESSRAERDLYLGAKYYQRDVFIIQGDRGTGKTCYINQLFTSNNKYLNKKDVIWIRLNLGDDFSDDNDPDLHHWLLSKLTKVIFRYYLNNAAFSDLLGELGNYINQRSPILQEKYQKNLDSMKEHFCERKGSQMLNNKLVEPALAKHILNYIINKNCSLIYILDGFDRIEITPSYRDKFNNIRKNIGGLFHLDTKLGGCYIIVTRTDTIQYLTGTSSFESSRKRNNRFKELAVVPFNRICESRISYLRKKVPTISDQYKWQIYDWDVHLEEFENYLINTLETKEGAEASISRFINALDNIYGSNHRAKVQIMQICYHDFLRQKKYRKRYKLIEQMCKGGFKYPPIIYYYDSHDNLLVPSVESKLFDNVFMPVLFRFPFYKGYSWNKLPYANTYLLAALRIIQVIHAYSKWDNQERTTLEIPGVKLLECLETYFGYQKELVYALLEEFLQAALIILDRGILASPSSLENVTIITTPKMNSLYSVNYKSIDESIISDIAYLNMCAMRVPLNLECIKKDCPMPYFRAVDFEDVNITVWSTNKILNTVSLYRLIKKASQIEKNKLKHLKLTKSLQEILSLFPFDNFLIQMKKSIIYQITRMIKEMDQKDLGLLNSSFENYDKKLCKSK